VYVGLGASWAGYFWSDGQVIFGDFIYNMLKWWWTDNVPDLASSRRTPDLLHAQHNTFTSSRFKVIL